LSDSETQFTLTCLLNSQWHS